MFKHIANYYTTPNDTSRKNGIYCPVFDRLLLIDDLDMWVTLDTAKVLSSKIASTVYILPETFHLDNENCLNWTLLNKTTQKRENSTDLVRGQIPLLKTFNGNFMNFHDPGYPEDYKSPEGIEMLHKLKEFANVTQLYMYAAKLTQAMGSAYDMKSFGDEMIDSNLLQGLERFHGPTEYNASFLKTIKSIFYFANTVDEAKSKVKEFVYRENFHPAYRARLRLFYTILEGKVNEL